MMDDTSLLHPLVMPAPNDLAVTDQHRTDGDAAGGAAKRGMAWLSGLLRWGRCGRKLQVAYSGTTGRVPRYVCRGGRVDRGSSSCLTVGGLRLDRAVHAAVLEALQPAGIQAAFRALDQVATAQDTHRQALELALEKAR